MAITYLLERRRRSLAKLAPEAWGWAFSWLTTLTVVVEPLRILCPLALAGLASYLATVIWRYASLWLSLRDQQTFDSLASTSLLPRQLVDEVTGYTLKHIALLFLLPGLTFGGLTLARQASLDTLALLGTLMLLPIAIIYTVQVWTTWTNLGSVWAFLGVPLSYSGLGLATQATAQGLGLSPWPLALLAVGGVGLLARWGAIRGLRVREPARSRSPRPISVALWDFNPVLARLAAPLAEPRLRAFSALGLVLWCLGGLLAPPWFLTVAASILLMLAAGSGYMHAQQERARATLDVLRQTSLKASVLVDGWALAAWLPALAMLLALTPRLLTLWAWPSVLLATAAAALTLLLASYIGVGLVHWQDIMTELALVSYGFGAYLLTCPEQASSLWCRVLLPLVLLARWRVVSAHRAGL
ncbi:MAG: hypothetical protein AB7S38_30945 [Vulcanimicrobiota bacterium]